MVNQLVQALHPGAGLAVDSQADLKDTDATSLLASGIDESLYKSRSNGRSKQPADTSPTSLPAECQGAACYARAALNELATACLKSRSCRDSLQVKQAGQK